MFLLFLVVSLLSPIPFIHSVSTITAASFIFCFTHFFPAGSWRWTVFSSLLTKPLLKYRINGAGYSTGLYSSIRLHPYEYIYYNILVNRTGGASRTYEMDYWTLSLKEALML